MTINRASTMSTSNASVNGSGDRQTRSHHRAMATLLTSQVRSRNTDGNQNGGDQKVGSSVRSDIDGRQGQEMARNDDRDQQQKLQGNLPVEEPIVGGGVGVDKAFGQRERGAIVR